ncbi:MAG: acetate kinase [Bacilli bacterium]
MKILAVNAGSSSLKFQMYEMPEEQVLISGVFERIGMDGSFYTIKFNGEKKETKIELKNHEEAVKILSAELINYKVVENLEDIKGIGHRIVQGADDFEKSVVINDEVLNKIDELSALAPLHNPAAVVGIKAFKKILKKAIAVAVFDTSFHQTMEPVNYLYALPYEWYTDYKVRRYGAHGTSHKYVASRVCEILGRQDLKIITCHIGNGGSITAVKNGKCVETSMGFTPNAGLIMGTRCGEIDASIIPYMIKQLNLSPNDIDNIINKKSGLLALSGVSSDSRDIEQGINEGNQRCLLAQKMYVKRVIEYIAKYYVLLNGADVIVFTAGIGENSISTRKEIIEGLACLGIKLDEEANNVRGIENLITSKQSTLPCYVIPTDEELMIAKDTLSLII